MNILKKFLPSTTPTTAAEIATSLEAARAERTAAASEQAALADRRAEALVSGSDAAVDKVEAELTATARKLDRLDAVIARLAARHAEAASVETAAEIEAQATGAQEAVDRLAELYAKIDTATHELNELFAQAKPLAARIDSWNQRGHQLGRQRLMFTPVDIVKQRTAGAIR